MWLFSNHCRAWSAACWSWLSPASLSQTSHSELSPTYLLMFTSVPVRRSLMWMTNPTGPKSVPWGTPALMVVHSDTMSPSLVHWRRPHAQQHRRGGKSRGYLSTYSTRAKSAWKAVIYIHSYNELRGGEGGCFCTTQRPLKSAVNWGRMMFELFWSSYGVDRVFASSKT